MFKKVSILRILLILVVGLSLAVLVLYLLFWKAAEQAGKLVPVGVAALMERVDRLADTMKDAEAQNHPGIQILKNYASATTRPEDDLQAMAHAFSNLLLLAKGNAPFRMGANEEFAAALLGKNSAKEVFLKAPHPCLNDKAQLIDRWGTPLFFHVRDASRIDIRSAGADQEMWTPDDLQRRYDGEFYHGDELPEPKEK